jgi:Na+/H+ antiporter NhaC
VRRAIALSLSLAFGAALAPAAAPAAAQSAPEVDAPRVVLPGVPFSLTATLPAQDVGGPLVILDAEGEQISRGMLRAGEQEIQLTVDRAEQLPLRLEALAGSFVVSPRFLPGWVSILPPLLAIALALIFREVVSALFIGVWLGAFFWAGLDPLAGTLRVIDTFALPELADPDHAAIVIFSLLIGGIVGIIGRNGGTHGIVERLSPYATTPRRGLLATYAQGLAIFFDDYASTLIVGNTMRPVTDRLRVSREKLAYVVDSTSAPIASITFVSTWVGYEISLIADGLQAASASVAAADPALAATLAGTSAFSVFLDTIPYRFYPLLALVFVLAVIWMRRDFGPMQRAEARAASGGGLHREGAFLMTDTSSGMMDPAPGVKVRWWNAALPVLTVVLGVVIGLYASGRSALGAGTFSLREIFGEANSFHVLLWASLLGTIVAVLLTVTQRVLTLQQTIDAWLSGLRSMVLAMVILVLAWSLGQTAEVLGTAQFISSVIEGNVPVRLLPVLVFAVAAAVSFATGTSWGTMAILLPLVIPMGAELTAAGDFATDGHYTILLGVVSSVLAGSIFGDHCSPISDTTVMSSMASACDHLDHVRTQLPYALLVAAVAMLVGDIPTAYGLSPWISLAVASALLIATLRIFGKPALTHFAAGEGAGRAVAVDGSG